MPPSRKATPIVGAVALVLVGGAVATGIALVMTYVRLYESPTLRDVRISTGYYAFECLLVGVFTALGTLLARPRDPVTPVAAAVSGYVALYVGQRIGVIVYSVTQGYGMPSGHELNFILRPHFEGWDLLAVLAAGAIAGLRVVMVAGGTAPRGPAPAFGAQPGYPHPQFQPPPPVRPPVPGHPPAYGPPGQPYQPPMGQFPPQGGAPGTPQGGGPPYGGV
ncbi:hypothetical protein [Actinomadura litoris]|uniref:Uncharacterized protein n=1 Tax=Actinomadura litoris TaxID=2678616 RepID=A0A7K1L9M8_9ACTN|nr:hypothetical protein [Actinomadura litoris]MUN41130.1 hypothetical protein [Actinomadura litoris]